MDCFSDMRLLHYKPWASVLDLSCQGIRLNGALERLVSERDHATPGPWRKSFQTRTFRRQIDRICGVLERD